MLNIDYSRLNVCRLKFEWTSAGEMQGLVGWLDFSTRDSNEQFIGLDLDSSFIRFTETWAFTHDIRIQSRGLESQLSPSSSPRD